MITDWLELIRLILTSNIHFSPVNEKSPKKSISNRQNTSDKQVTKNLLFPSLFGS